jgi:hypothetical protein
MASKRVRRLKILAKSRLWSMRDSWSGSGGPDLPLTDKQLVFTVTNGRSGSGTLSKLLQCVAAIHAEHEPHPRFDAVMRAVQRDPRLARSFLKHLKLPAIALTDKPTYIETSHLFCKGFLEPLLELGLEPDLVVLRRAARDVALSMYRLNTIPGRTKEGRQYYLEPRDATLTTVERARDLSDYQLCYWHVLETEARQEIYAQIVRGKGSRVVETSVEQLNMPGELERVVEALDIAITDACRRKIEAVRGQRINPKEYVPEREVPSEAELTQVEEEVRQRTRSVA